jgi:hypothetical protein
VGRNPIWSRQAKGAAAPWTPLSQQPCSQPAIVSSKPAALFLEPALRLALVRKTLAQKLGQPQPFLAVFLQECMG